MAGRISEKDKLTAGTLRETLIVKPDQILDWRLEKGMVAVIIQDSCLLLRADSMDVLF